MIKVGLIGCSKSPRNYSQEAGEKGGGASEMSLLPFVSVIVPCRNEEGFISLSLDSILASDYPQDRLEVLVVDGMSDDGTDEIVREYAKRHPTVRNGAKAHALQLGVENGKSV